jgi:tetratricopeptide (TPR) repeat protein
MITFNDKEGEACPGKGVYKIKNSEYYIAFDLIDDSCGGRIKSTMGYWTRPNFEEFINKLSNQIGESGEPENYLNRARIYLALGRSQEARNDLDVYLKMDSLDAGVYLNRAGTRFPLGDLTGVIDDCNKVIELDPENKNAYFLRGLALYDLGNDEEACNDFSKAIELGFDILKVAESEKCAEYWQQ